jgi:hypothetical protein
VICLDYVGYEFLNHIFDRWFSDPGDYVRDCDKDYYIDHEDSRNIVSISK